jgi:CRISPR-associated protein (TIGR03986 family)
MSRFHSPYQFIPVTGRLHRTDADGEIVRDCSADEPLAPRPVPLVDWDDVKHGRSQARHDLWQQGRLSGRLTCRIRTRGPVLVGGEQKDARDRPGRIRNYLHRGEPALPASSLRGMTAAVAEALSQSALRILPDAMFHQRMDMKDSFKALGLLRRQGENWSLLPLALTHLPALPPPLRPHDRRTPEEYEQKRQAAIETREIFKRKWLPVFPPETPLAQCLAAYFGLYAPDDDLAKRYRTFQASSAPDYSIMPNDTNGAQLSQITLGDALTDERPPPALKWRGTISYRHLGTEPQQATADAGDRRAVLYVLGRTDDMPKKQHEWLIPYASDWAERVQPLTVPKAVIDRFERIAADRDADNRASTALRDRVPHLPSGYPEQSPAGVRRPRRPGSTDGGLLRDGDLVYFDVLPSHQPGGAPEVSAISWSAIWREAIRGTLHGAFAAQAGADSLPWSAARDGLTPAELLFGVVQEGIGEKARNLASRVRFSDALAPGGAKLMDDPPSADNGETEPGVLLKPQLSPKPPSTSMYCQSADGSPVRRHAKQPDGYATLDLAGDPEKGVVPHQLKGRKAHLAQEVSSDPGQRPYAWELDPTVPDPGTGRPPSLKRLADLGARWGNPIRKHQTFWFHVDFDNLDQAELDLLCIALQPATAKLYCPFKDGYLHRLGWGKAFGLGNLELSVEGLFLVQRDNRYRPTALRRPRYALAWRSPRLAQPDAALAARYADELAAPANVNLGDSLADKLGTDLVDAEAFRALTRIGNPEAQDTDYNGDPLPVTYPRALGQAVNGDDDGYEWFVNNDRADDAHYQHLEPVPTGPDPEPRLPSLKQNGRR